MFTLVYQLSHLTFNLLDLNRSRWHLEISYFCTEYRAWHFRRTVSRRELIWQAESYFMWKINIINLSSADFSWWVLKIKKIPDNQTLTMLWADSADDKLMWFFLFFPQNRSWYFMQKEMICMKYQILFSGKIRKIFQNAICSNFYPACPVLTKLSIS